jgi:hypothetical protein
MQQARGTTPLDVGSPLLALGPARPDPFVAPHRTKCLRPREPRQRVAEAVLSIDRLVDKDAGQPQPWVAPPQSASRNLRRSMVGLGCGGLCCMKEGGDAQTHRKLVDNRVLGTEAASCQKGRVGCCARWDGDWWRDASILKSSGVTAIATTRPLTHSGICTAKTPTCPSGTTSISWNQTGPQGPAGLQGQTGAIGPPGPEYQLGSGTADEHLYWLVATFSVADMSGVRNPRTA